MTGLEIAALAIAATTTGISIYSGQQAQAQQKVATRAARAQNDLQAARQRRDAIRQARIAQADLAVKGVSQGVQASSAIAGGQGSIATQLNSNLGFLDTFNQLSNQASKALDSAATWQGIASDADKIGNLAMTTFGNSDHIQRSFNKRGG